MTSGSNKADLIAPERKLLVNFTKNNSPFDIKSESSYNAYLSNKSLVLGLRKFNCIAWVDTIGYEYQDHLIDAKIRLDSLGGYAAAGIKFRIVDDSSYYLALISSKGYFRLDVIKDDATHHLIAWTEISDFNPADINFKIITYGTYLIFIVNNKWLGEISDDYISQGRLGFALVSYEENDNTQPAVIKDDEYTCMAYLESFSIDTRVKKIEDEYIKWNVESNINADGHLRLAETFAVMGESLKAMEQINKAWRRRDNAIRCVATTYTEVRTKKELLLAARLTFRLGHYEEAEEHINSILDQWPDSPEGKLACSEKIKILNELNKFTELKDFILNNPFKINKDLDYYTLLARCFWELKEYNNSAEAWDKAFELNSENGVYAANAGNALEYAGNKKEALARFITAGKIFLNQDNKAELSALMRRLSILGSRNWEARALAGKWAFSNEDYAKCTEEFAISNKLRNSMKPRPDADPALYYLWGLVLNMSGKIKSAIRLLETAVETAPEYGLFRFKLAEIKLLNNINPLDAAAELKLAYKHLDDPEGKMAEYAGNLLRKVGDIKNAKYFFAKVPNADN